MNEFIRKNHLASTISILVVSILAGLVGYLIPKILVL